MASAIVSSALPSGSPELPIAWFRARLRDVHRLVWYIAPRIPFRARSWVSGRLSSEVGIGSVFVDSRNSRIWETPESTSPLSGQPFLKLWHSCT